MSSSVHAANKTQNILILGKDFTQELANTTSCAGKLYSINFTKINTKFCLSLHYNGAKVIYLLIAQKLLNSKQKILKLLKDFSVNNMKKIQD